MSDKAVTGLNAELCERIASFPTARSELVGFHFKHTVEDYVAAVVGRIRPLNDPSRLVDAL